MRTASVLTIIFFTLNCGESGFKGSSTQHPPLAPDPVKNSSSKAAEDPTKEDGFDNKIRQSGSHSDDGSNSNNNTSDFNNTSPSNNNTNGASGNDRPVGVVDGTEVFDRCDSCEKRGVELGRQQGFQTGRDKAINLGFYKIDPSKGLCDVHFMADLRIPIDDHAAKSTIGNRQIILYCPCNCAWKDLEEIGFGGGPPPFGGGGGFGGW